MAYFLGHPVLSIRRAMSREFLLLTLA